jgi:hypothetical protein
LARVNPTEAEHQTFDARPRQHDDGLAWDFPSGRGILGEGMSTASPKTWRQRKIVRMDDAVVPPLIRLAARIALATPIGLSATGCSPRESAPQQTQLSATASSMSLWMAQTILEKLDSGFFDELKKEEIKVDLQTLESTLGLQDLNLKNKISLLRQDMDGKASAADIRNIVREVLTELEKKLSTIDTRLTDAAVQQKAVADIFGYIPTVTPSPLLRTDIDGTPKAHPLTAQWAKLVSDSEVHRIELEKLSAIYKPNAPEMQQGLATLGSLQKQATELHLQIELELSKQLLQRVELLKTRRATHPDVRNFDANIASLAWLAAVSKPEQEGRYAGTMQVPKDLTGPAASDIVAAFELSGVSREGIVPLYRRLVDFMPATGTTGEVAMPQEFMRMKERYDQLAAEASMEFRRATAVHAELGSLLKDHSGLHPDVRAKRKERADILQKAHALNTKCNTLLTEAIAAYLERLKFDHPMHKPMMYYNWRVVRPLADIYQHTHCYDWNNAESVEASWKTFLQLHDDCAVKYGALQMRSLDERAKGSDTKIVPDDFVPCDVDQLEKADGVLKMTNKPKTVSVSSTWSHVTVTDIRTGLILNWAELQDAEGGKEDREFDPHGNLLVAAPRKSHYSPPSGVARAEHGEYATGHVFYEDGYSRYYRWSWAPFVVHQ